MFVCFTDTVLIDQYGEIIVLGCPVDFSTVVPLHGGAVFWTEPRFTSVNGDSEFDEEQSHKPGDNFVPGNHVVTYVVVDTNAVCAITIDVFEGKECL